MDRNHANSQVSNRNRNKSTISELSPASPQRSNGEYKDDDKNLAPVMEVLIDTRQTGVANMETLKHMSLH